MMNKTIFKQSDSSWGGLPYPSKKSNVSSSGCGLVACTHIAIEQPSKKKWTPKKLRKYMVDNGYAVEGQGTRWEGITNTLKYIGHSSVVRIWDKPMTDAWKELNKGGRIGVLLFSSGKGPDGTIWTSGGHYVAFTGYKVEDGQHWFYCKDSGGRDHDGWYSYEKSMKGVLPKLWIVRKTPATRLIGRAYSYAWRTTSGKKNAPYPKGRAKKQYAAALDKYFGKTRKWQDSAKKGASCDVFIATCIRAAGIDSKAPRGLGRSYFNKSDKFKLIKNVTTSTVQDGDIISIIWKNGNPHWCMAWDGKILEASLKGWYPKSTATLKSRLSKSGKQSVYVYRAK